MSNLIEELRKSRDKATVAYQEFVLHTREGKDGLFCFFEGERGSDNAYYVPRIREYIGKYYPISCKGKEKVLKVHELISSHKEYSKYRKAFFIDRDFDQPLLPQNPPIFETPCYSVENFYVSVDVFKEILKNQFFLSEVAASGKPEFDVCVEVFSERQKEFHQATLLFNAWYACLRETRNSTGTPTGVSLDDKLPKDFIKFSLELISADYDTEKLGVMFPNALEVSQKSLDEKITEFSKCEQDKIFRGKYELQFLVDMIERLLQDSSKSHKYLKKKIKFPFGEKLSIGQAMTVFSAYAETPKSLIEYLSVVTK
jgi:Protein of unknown function (DUF4435)